MSILCFNASYGRQKCELGTDMGPVEFSILNDTAKLAEHFSLMTIDRTGDRIDSVSLKLEAFDIEIKDGWLTGKPKALKPPETA